VKKINISGNDYKSFNKLFAVKLLMIILLIIFCIGLLFPVVSPEFGGKIIINHLLNNLYSSVCHQSEQALVHINNNQALVCARCLGIYFGALILLIITMTKSFKLNFGLKPLLIFSAPMMIDAIAVRFSFYPYSKSFALITGLIFGAIVLFYILDSIENSFYTQQNERYEF
jgi:uncharacterized membrane protein